MRCARRLWACAVEALEWKEGEERRAGCGGGARLGWYWMVVVVVGLCGGDGGRAAVVDKWRCCCCQHDRLARRVVWEEDHLRSAPGPGGSKPHRWRISTQAAVVTGTTASIKLAGGECETLVLRHKLRRVTRCAAAEVALWCPSPVAPHCGLRPPLLTAERQRSCDISFP